jgi:hypothetical protein
LPDLKLAMCVVPSSKRENPLQLESRTVADIAITSGRFLRVGGVEGPQLET